MTSARLNIPLAPVDALAFTPDGMRRLRLDHPHDIGTTLAEPHHVVVYAEPDPNDWDGDPWTDRDGNRYTDAEVQPWIDTLATAYAEHVTHVVDLTDPADMHRHLDLLRAHLPSRVAHLVIDGDDLGGPVVDPDPRPGHRRTPWHWVAADGVAYVDDNVSTLDPDTWPPAMIVQFRHVVAHLPVGTVLDTFHSKHDLVVVTGHSMLPAGKSYNAANPDGDRFVLHATRVDGATVYDGTRHTFAEVDDLRDRIVR